MDKRTLLFVLSLTLTLFGVNLFFQHQNMEKKQEWQRQQLQKQAEKEKLREAEIAQRTASPDALPLAKLYADPEGNQLLTSGVFNDGNVLTLSWNPLPPKTVYLLATDTDELQKAELSYESRGLGTPLIYKTTDRPFKATTLPSFGKVDVQLVDPFNFASPQPYSVTLGEYIDGHFSFPGKIPSQLTESRDHRQYSAIALLKTLQGYVVVGFYDPSNQSLVKISQFNHLADQIEQTTQTLPKAAQKGIEKFYVLETPYQQFVFSNYGGALAEINLPFQNEANAFSVVKEIDFDRDIIAKHPYNAYFPANGYYTPAQNDQQGFTYHEKGRLGGYYPLLRRTLVEKPPRNSVVLQPKHYALNIVSEYPELAEMVYEVKHFDKQSITFEASQGFRRITKTFSLGAAGVEEAPYCLNVEINIEGDARGLWLTSGIPEVEMISGTPAPSLKYRLTRNQKSDVEKIDLPAKTVTVTSSSIDWICNSNGFLGMILDPLTETDPGYRIQYISGTAVPSRLTEIDQAYDRFPPSNMPGYMVSLPIKQRPSATTFRFFAGPFDTGILKDVDAKYSNYDTGYNPDYISCQTMHGWFTFISGPFSKFLFVLMNFFHTLSGSWALSIFLLTICLRLMLYPLNAWSTKSMVNMQKISPEVTAIQEKYKKDPKKAQMEVLNLYRERGVNPASGCLPLLIQMPFLIGMFDLLKSSFVLRGASFIPGWIDDLTAPDVVFSWDRPIFFIGTDFHILPFIIGGVMFLQQRLMSTAPKDPNLMTDQQRQQRAMGTMMTAVFTIMFYHFPSGLNIYWISSLLLGILQQWWTARQLKNVPLKSQPKEQLKRTR